MRSYVTKDFNMAAILLITDGVLFEDMERDDSICYFTFSPPGLCEQTAMELQHGNLVINAKKLIRSQRQVRQMIHDDVGPMGRIV
jgi:hypothetical protein